MAILARSPGAAGWAEVAAMELPVRLDPEVAPAWLGDLAVFPTWDPARGTAGLCAGALDQAAVCLDTGAPRLGRLAADGDTLHVLLGQDGGVWEIQTFQAGDFAP